MAKISKGMKDYVALNVSHVSRKPLHCTDVTTPYTSHVVEVTFETIAINVRKLFFFHIGHPSEAGFPPQKLLSPETWFEDNRKISITKEISITIDFALPEESQENTTIF